MAEAGDSLSASAEEASLGPVEEAPPRGDAWTTTAEKGDSGPLLSAQTAAARRREWEGEKRRAFEESSFMEGLFTVTPAQGREAAVRPPAEEEERSRLRVKATLLNKDGLPPWPSSAENLKSASATSPYWGLQLFKVEFRRHPLHGASRPQTDLVEIQVEPPFDWRQGH